MKYLQTLILALLLPIISIAQQVNLPVGFAPGEKEQMQAYLQSRLQLNRGIQSPPPFQNIRTMAEWEEIQSLVVTWTSYIPTVREIVRYARLECQVIIICADSNQVKSNLTSNGIPLSNIAYIEADYNTVWMRDYGPNTVYANDVDSLFLVDWIYNRPRPDDDVLPDEIAQSKGLNLYSTTALPYDLVHTGGNFMADGLGTAFSSELILDENAAGGQYNLSDKSEADIDALMGAFMGINRYAKMPVLPYDGIHHIDMHMKLLDEETLLMGEYPTGIADGPQIEANLLYVLNNYPTAFNNPYKIVRVQMPPGSNGNYPDSQPWWNAGEYRTYTNSVFINKTLLVPIYDERYDTTALRIMREQLPGYKVVGIDCNDIIQASGALHCITRAIGVNDPLWIAHPPLADTYETSNPYELYAKIKHRSGIQEANVYYSTDTTQGYQPISMTLTDPTNDIWSAYIPAQLPQTEVFYYIHATANEGKTQVRPITAPEGYWKFQVLGTAASIDEQLPSASLQPAFPNPASAITCIPILTTRPTHIQISLHDLMGREILQIANEKTTLGQQHYFFNAQNIPTGTYILHLNTPTHQQSQKILIH